MGNPETSDDKYRLQILSRAISVLFAFSALQPERTLDDLASELDINKTSLLRILRTLELEQFLLRTDDTYRLGPRVLDIGKVFLSTLSVHRVAQPQMADLATTCNQTVSLAILDDFEVVYIGIEMAQQELGIQGEVGGRHPSHATGLGKVMLADLAESELDDLLEGRELHRLTHRTIVDTDQLRERLRQVRRDGYALDDEERGIGIRCIAAPIRDHSGNVIAAMSVAGPIFYMTEDAVPRTRGLLLAATDSISRKLGWTPEPVVV